MKLKLLSLVPVLAFALAATPALAQNVKIDFRGETQTSPFKVKAESKAEAEEKRASSTEKRAEVRQSAEVRFASSTEARMDLQFSIIKRKAAHTARVFNATVERLEKIIVRIESRIEKMEEKGLVTAEAEASIAIAKDHLVKAKASVAAFASADFSGDSLRENMSELRSLSQEVKAHIKEAHTALKDAVRSLKVSAEAEVEAEEKTEENN